MKKSELLKEIRLPEEISRRYVTVHPVPKNISGQGSSARRMYFVDFTEVDVVNQVFIADRNLKCFSDGKKANEYARKKAKELGAEAELADVKKAKGIHDDD